MKRLLTFSAVGLVAAALPALALAQTTPQARPQQTAPPTQPEQTMPQQMQQRSTPMRKPSDTAQQEIDTAHAHALMAQGAKSVDMAHTHLHHVINCLEGSSGANFDADAGNPCKGQGQGAIPDSMANQRVQERLKQALAEAQSGLETGNLDKAQQSAAKVASLLQGRSTPKGMMRKPGQ